MIHFRLKSQQNSNIISLNFDNTIYQAIAIFQKSSGLLVWESISSNNIKLLNRNFVYFHLVKIAPYLFLKVALFYYLEQIITKRSVNSRMSLLKNVVIINVTYKIDWHLSMLGYFVITIYRGENSKYWPSI